MRRFEEEAPATAATNLAVTLVVGFMARLALEATLMVLDRTVGEQMDRIFIDDLRYAEEITAARFRKRSWFQRMAEREPT
jgi:hypothetical protein